jgi:ketosteroid isomerase-like protein
MKIYKKISLALFLASITFMAAAQSEQEPASLKEAKKAIAVSNATYFAAFAKNDGSIVNFYAEDACLLPPNSPFLCGPAEILKFFKFGYDKIGLRDGKFITKKVYGDGHKFVTEEGLWQAIDGKGKIVDDGKYLVLWKKTKKGWKMYRDSFSSNRPQK